MAKTKGKAFFYITCPAEDRAEVTQGKDIALFPLWDILAGPYTHKEAACLSRDIFNDLFHGKGASFAEAYYAAMATPGDPRKAAEHWLASVAWPAGKTAETP